MVVRKTEAEKKEIAVSWAMTTSAQNSDLYNLGTFLLQACQDKICFCSDMFGQYSFFRTTNVLCSVKTKK